MKYISKLLRISFLLISINSIGQSYIWETLPSLPGTNHTEVKVFTRDKEPGALFAVSLFQDITTYDVVLTTYKYNSQTAAWVNIDNNISLNIFNYDRFEVIEKANNTYFTFVNDGFEVYLKSFDGNNITSNFSVAFDFSSIPVFNINELSDRFYLSAYDQNVQTTITEELNLNTGVSQNSFLWPATPTNSTDQVVNQKLFIKEEANQIYMVQQTTQNLFVGQKWDVSSNTYQFISSSPNNYITNALISGAPNALGDGSLETFNIVNGDANPNFIYRSNNIGDERVFAMPLEQTAIANVTEIDDTPMLDLTTVNYPDGYIVASTFFVSQGEEFSIKKVNVAGGTSLTLMSPDPILLSQPVTNEDIAYDMANDRAIVTYVNANGSIIIKASNFVPVNQSSNIVQACFSSFTDLSSGDSILLVEDLIITDANSTDTLRFNYQFTTDINIFDGASGNVEFRQDPVTSNYYVVAGFTGNAGNVWLHYTLNDGYSTIDDSVQIEVINAIDPVFNIPTGYDFCTNGNVVHMNAEVDNPGGQFIFGDLILDDDNYFNPADYDVSTFGLNGNIIYEVEDANGCVGTSVVSYTFHEPADLSLMAVPSSCGLDDGSVEAIVNTSTTYSSYWNTGDLDVEIVNDLAPGSYYFTVIDDNGCIAMDMINVESSDIQVSASVTDPSCFGANDGAIDITVTTPNPYTVLWSSGSAAEDAVGLPGGSYQAIITLDNGCSSTQEFDLVEPALNVIEHVSVLPDCNVANGEINIGAITNGIAPFTYTLNGNAASATNSGLAAGFYTMEVEDGNGCVVSKDIDLGENNAGGTTAIVSKTDCGLDNGAIDLMISPIGTQAVQSIQWSNTAITEDITGLSPAVYNCEVTFDDGCKSFTSWEVKAKKPLQNNICLVTVDSLTTTNLVVWEKVQDATDNISHYNIYRETSNAGQFLKIDTVSVFSESVFNDVVASPITKSWRYRISAVNNCGVEGPLSVTQKTLHSVFEVQPLNNEILVTWDDYEGIDYTKVNLWRYTTADDWQLIGNGIDISINQQIDNVPNTLDLNYMVEIDLQNTCTATAGKVQDFNSTRSNKTKGVFNPGDGTGDSNNGVEEIKNTEFSLIAYPNPASTVLSLSTAFYSSNNSLNLVITDNLGKVLYQKQITANTNIIDLSNFANGLYTITASTSNNTSHFNFVKH